MRSYQLLRALVLIIVVGSCSACSMWRKLTSVKGIDAPSVKSPAQPVSSAAMEQYMVDLKRRIKKCWFPPKDGGPVDVSFKINRDGQVSELNILRSSGTDSTDASAMKAILNAAPYRPLPADSPESIQVKFTFDYTVFQS